MKSRDFDEAKKVLELWSGECGEKDPYQKDLTFLLESIKDRSYPNEKYLCEELLQLLEAKEGLKEFPSEITLEKPQDKSEQGYFEELNQIMKVGNGPAGIMDAKQNPDLFDELVTRVTLQRGNEKAFEKYGKLLAAPAGRKAGYNEAALKGILAGDMVERARYLAKYEDPDWAYDSHVFLNGNREDKSYSKEAANWYSFKEDKLNDCGVLFACADGKQQDAVKDFGAVALGKAEQRKQFFEKVLQPMEKECYASREKIVDRKNQYAKARKEFLEQLDVVSKLQQELDDNQFRMLRVLSDKETREKTIADAKGTIEHNEQLIADAETVRNGYTEDRKSLDEAMEEMSQTIDQETAKLKEFEKRINEYKQKTTEGFAKSEETLKSVNIVTKILSKKKYDAAVELSDQYHKAACEAQDNDLKLSSEAKKLGNKMHELLDQQAELEEKRAFFTEEITKRNRDINACKQTIDKKKEEVSETEALLAESNGELDKLFEEMKKAGEAGKRIILDKPFLRELLSDDKELSGKRKKEIPWVTPKYYAEREKLYYLAVKLCGEFARASHHCRENLITLEQYWGVRMGDDQKPIEFHPADKMNMAGTLYQTLYLIAPAISVMLEETADLMADIRKPGIFGRGIIAFEGEVDAKDAKKTLGTLYRCRQADIFLKRAEKAETVEKAETAEKAEAVEETEKTEKNS